MNNKSKYIQPIELILNKLEALATIHNLYQRFGISQEGAHFMMHDQSIDTLDVLKKQEDDDTHQLCHIAYKPRGLIANPYASAAILVLKTILIGNMARIHSLKVCQIIKICRRTSVEIWYVLNVVLYTCNVSVMTYWN